MSGVTTNKTRAVSRRRSRQEIVRDNDHAIRQALLHLVADAGWDSVTISGVAKGAGLTVGAVYGRAETKSELGNLVWSAAVFDRLRSELEDLVTAYQTGDPAQLAAAIDVLESDPNWNAVVVEFLIASLFDEELDEVVGADTRTLIEALIAHPGADGRTTPHSRAANVLLLSMTLGRMTARRGIPDLPPLSEQQIATSAAMPGAAPRDNPDSDAQVVFLRPVPQGAGLDDVYQICTAVIDVLARVGYRRATIARMGRAAGMSGGALFSRFRNKAELVAEAAATRLVSPLGLWEEFAEVEAQYGPRASRAIWVADVVRPENRKYWAVNLELARVSEFVPELQDFRATAQAHQHTNLGVMLVASFAPDIHELPYAGPFQAGYTT